MENLFKVFHREESLKPGERVLYSLASHIEKHVSLPFKVILFFVRCRMCFRMRVLNSKVSSRKKKNKMSKLTK